MNGTNCGSPGSSGCTPEKIPIVNGNGVENTLRVRVTGTNFSPNEGFYARRAGVSVSGPFVHTQGQPDFLLTELMRSGQPLDLVTTYSLDPSVQGLQNLRVAVFVGLDKKTVSVSGYCWDSADAHHGTVPIFIGSGFDLAITDIFVDPSSPGVIAKASNGTLLVRGAGQLGLPTQLNWTVTVQGANISSADGPSVALRTQLDGNCSPTGGNPNTEQCNVTVLLAQLAERGGRLAYPLNGLYEDSYRPGSLGFSPEGVKAHMNGIGGTIFSVTETDYLNNSLAVPAALIPTLYVSNVVLTQAVNNFTLEPNANLLADLVLGKSTVLALDVSADLFPSQTPPPSIAQEPVTIVVQTTDPSSILRSFSKTTTLGGISSSTSVVASNAKTLTITSPVFRPMNPGTFQFQVQAQASVFGVTYTLPFARKPGDFSTPRTPQSVNSFQVKPTSISVNYVRLEGGTCVTKPGVVDPVCTDLLNETAAEALPRQANKYLQDIFPVADFPPLPVQEAGVISGGTAQTCPPIANLDVTEHQRPILSCDLLNTWSAGKRAGVTNIIGIVPGNYFSVIGPSSRAAGLTSTSTEPGVKNKYNVSLVREDAAQTVRHEIGHQLGIPHAVGANPPAMISKLVISNGVPTLVDLFDFMNPGPCRDLEDPDTCDVAPSEQWVSPFEWFGLFSNLRTSFLDPEVITVPILLGPSEVAYILPTSLRSLDDTTVDDEHGQYSIRLNDLHGAILSEVRFSPASEVVGSDGTVFPLSYPFFLATLPMPAGTVTMQITHQGAVIKTFMPSENLLRDAILAIPDNGFDKSPSQRRNALLNKVSAFTHSLASGSTKGALNKLENDIRKHVSNWVLSSYEVSSALQMSRAQVLATIDRLIEHLRSSQ